MKANTVNYSTLGPAGTCSEFATKYHMKIMNLNGNIKLFASFEKAIEKLIEKEVDLSIVPSAYEKLSEILFKNHDKIILKEVFKLATPNLVLAISTNKTEWIDIKSIVVHASPIYMVKKYYPEARYINANSNAEAAKLLNNGIGDACLTTEICVKQYSLTEIRNFGKTEMGWHVFKNRDN